MFQQTEKMFTSKIFLWFISLSLFVYILYIWAEYIVPFVVALLLTLLILWLKNSYNKFIKNEFLSLILSLITYFFIFWIIVKIINLNIDEITLKWPEYKQKFEIWIQIFSEKTAMYAQQYFWMKIENISIRDRLIWLVNVPDILGNLVTGITFISIIFKNLVIILIYTLFLVFESKFFHQKMELIFAHEGQKRKIFQIAEEIKGDLKLYFLIRTILSFFTGLFTYIILIIFGLDFALFWGFIAFVFNFIPAIGSIVAVVFPILFSLIQFDSIYLTFWLLISLMLTQFCFGNLLEPKLLGNRLNLSPIVIILSLWFWAIIWWFVGMLLCVPIMVILNAVLSKFEATKPIAILCSEKGIIRWDFISLDEQKRKMIEKIRSKFKKKRR